MLRKMCHVLVAFAFVLSLGSVSSAAPAITLKCGMQIAPGTPNYEGLIKFEELVEARTNGAVQVEVYPSGQLGDEREMIEGLQMGTVDGYFGSTAPLTAWIPEFMVFDIAFLFDDYDHQWRVYDGELGKKLMALCPEFGIHPFTITDMGFSEIIHNGSPIKNPEDCVGKTIRCMESAGLMAYLSNAGANPIPMAMSETFNALQNGTIDGGTWPIFTIYFNKLYTIVENITLTDAIPTTLMFALSEASWQKIPAEYHDIVTQAAQEATARQRAYMLENLDRLLAEIEAEGGTNIIRTDRNAWSAALRQKCIDAVVPKYAPQEFVDIVNAAR